MEDVNELGEIEAPYGKQVIFKDITYDNGFKLLRIRIKEGKRFTDMDLDINTVKLLQKQFNDWLAAQPETPEAGE
jgi:hypothetical protein